MRIYMNISQIRRVIRGLREIQQQCHLLDQQFRNELEQLHRIWYGPAPDEYYAKQHHILLQYTPRFHAYLSEIIQILEMELQEYLRVDQW